MKSPLQFSDYVAYLGVELERRCSRNPRYSRRAFARDLGIQSGRLSEIFGGKQSLSRQSAEDVAKKLGLGDLDRAHFVDLVLSKAARSQSERRAAAERIEARRREVRYRMIEEDEFRFISDWYHLAIVELAKLPRFVGSAAWIAGELAVDVVEIREALARLERLQILHRNKTAWTFSVRDTLVPGGVPSNAIRKFHAQILSKAESALHSQPVKERDYTTVMMAIDRARLPEAKARILEFWQAMDRDFGGDREKTDLFTLGIQFFNLSGGRGDA